MTSAIFSFLTKYIPSDTNFINSLFVTAFVIRNNWVVKNNSLLSSLIINKNDCSYQYVLHFLHVLDEGNCGYTFEELINLFEFVVSPQDKEVNGAVYTPKYIRTYIEDFCWSKFQGNIGTCKVVDLSCGCGGFLYDMAIRLNKETQKSFKEIFAKHIYGIDIQYYSIERTKILLSLLAISKKEDDDFDFNLWCADSLSFDFTTKIVNYKGFDIILGNPPYVCSKKMLESTKTILRNWSVCSTGHPDLYIPFIQMAMENLSKDGVMGYITVNSFLKSLNGRALRQYLQEKRKLIHIVDFRGKQIFRSRTTYTCLLFIEHKDSDVLYYKIQDNQFLDSPHQYSQFYYADLNFFAGWNLNQTSKIQYLENIGTPIRKFVKSRHGIATLCNKVFIFSPQKETNDYYVLKQDGIEYKVEKDICRDIINPNKFNSDIDLATIVKKVIFPYYKDKTGKINIITEDVMQKKFPHTYSYLQSQRNRLLERDKGAAQNYPVWYQFGRTQSLNMPTFKLFVPKIANHAPHCVLVENPDLYFYNGFAFVSENSEELVILQKILESSFFWDYIVNSSKPYSSGYFSISGAYVYNFGIYNFTDEEKEYLLNETDNDLIHIFLENIYFKKSRKKV